MTRVEMIERIEELERKIFLKNMKDRMTDADYKLISQWNAEIRDLKAVVDAK